MSTKTQVVPCTTPPSVFLVSPTIDPPPTKVELRNARKRYPGVKNEWEARFLLMSEAWMKQTTHLGEAKQRTDALNQWLKHKEKQNE